MSGTARAGSRPPTHRHPPAASVSYPRNVSVPASDRRLLVAGHLAAAKHQLVRPGTQRTGPVHRPPAPVLPAAHGRRRVAHKISARKVSGVGECVFFFFFYVDFQIHLTCTLLFQTLFFTVRRVAGHQEHQAKTSPEQRPAGGDVCTEQQVESQGGRGPSQETRLDRTTSRTVAEIEASTGQTFDAYKILRKLVTIFYQFNYTHIIKNPPPDRCLHLFFKLSMLVVRNRIRLWLSI